MTVFKKFTDILNYQAPQHEAPSDEDMPEQTATYPFDALICESLLLICLSDARKYKNPLVSVDTYLQCWTQDLESQLNEAGIDPELFIRQAKSRLESPPYSETLSYTTSEPDITSSNSSRPTKMASPTSLF